MKKIYTSIKSDYILFLIMIVYILFFDNKAFGYDEPYYLDNVRLLQTLGLGKQFLVQMGGPAGPLHTFFFWLAFPLTGSNVILTRLVNPLLLILIIIISKQIVAKIFLLTEENNHYSTGFMFIPMVYVCAGMALTEMPALLMLTFSMFFLFKSDKNNKLPEIVAAAFFLSLAIIGRQPYLLLIFPFGLWVFVSTANKYINTFLFLAVAFCIPCILFYYWHGIAPSKGGDDAGRGFFNFKNFVLGFGYASLTMILINRNFFIRIQKKYLPYIVVLLLLAVLFCYKIDFGMPLMLTAMTKLIPAYFIEVYQKLIAALLILLAVYFVVSISFLIIMNWDNQKQVLLLVSLGIIVSSCGLINHQFSSRYVFQAALFMILCLPPQKKDRTQVALSIAGGILGMISLYTYALSI